VVERARIKEVLDEIALSQQGVIDEATAVRAGHMVGARTIIFGSVTEAAAEDTGGRERRTRCLQWKSKRSDVERVLGLGCEREQEFYVPCVTRKGKFGVAFKVVDVESGVVRYADNLKGETNPSKMCREGSRVDQYTDEVDILRAVLFSGSRGGSLPDKGQVIRQAMESALACLSGSLTPHNRVMTVAFKAPDSSIPPNIRQRVVNGMTWAKNRRLDRACEIWSEAYCECSGSLCLIYNLGVCREMNGDLAGALDYYKQADRMLSRPDPDVNAALDRVQRRLRANEKLRKMLTDFTQN